MTINDRKLTLKYRAKTFYFASLFLPQKIKKDIESLYVFCRYLDDLGDDLNLSKSNSFKKLKIIKKEILEKKSNFPAVSNFIDLMIKHKINKSIPLELINGIEYDLKEQVNIETFEQLVKSLEKTGRSSLLLKINRDDEQNWVTIKFKNN